MVQRYSKSGEMQNKLEFILIWEKNKEASFLETSYSLLGYPDSNQERQDQNLQCYHYTIPQTCGAFLKMRVQRYCFFSNHQKKSGLFYKKSQKKCFSGRFVDYMVYLCIQL